MQCKFKPKPSNVAVPKTAVKRFVWWNNPQICSELSQTTYCVHQSGRRTFWTLD